MISQQLLELKRKCDHRIATVGNLKVIYQQKRIRTYFLLLPLLENN